MIRDGALMALYDCIYDHANECEAWHSDQVRTARELEACRFLVSSGRFRWKLTNDGHALWKLVTDNFTMQLRQGQWEKTGMITAIQFELLKRCVQSSDGSPTVYAPDDGEGFFPEAIRLAACNFLRRTDREVFELTPQGRNLYNLIELNRMEALDV